MSKNQDSIKKQLESYRLRFHRLFDNINDGIIIHDTNGRIYDVNSAMYKRLGYCSQEMLDMNLKDLVPPEFGALVAERTEASPEDGMGCL